MASQYVLLDGSDEDNTVTVAVHTDVPSTGTNAAGVQWQTVVSQFVDGKPSVVPAAILPANRQSELDAGTRYEWTFTAEYDRNLSNADKRNALEADITAREAELLSELQNRLRFWGATGSIS